LSAQNYLKPIRTLKNLKATMVSAEVLEYNIRAKGTDAHQRTNLALLFFSL